MVRAMGYMPWGTVWPTTPMVCAMRFKATISSITTRSLIAPHPASCLLVPLPSLSTQFLPFHFISVLHVHLSCSRVHLTLARLPDISVLHALDRSVAFRFSSGALKTALFFLFIPFFRICCSVEGVGEWVEVLSRMLVRSMVELERVQRSVQAMKITIPVAVCFLILLVTRPRCENTKSIPDLSTRNALPYISVL